VTRVVFDTGAVVSALLFRSGPAARLRDHWRSGRVEAVVSPEMLDELVRVLAYPKFALTPEEIELLLADYLPFTRSSLTLRAAKPRARLPRCRDAADQHFLELAAAVRAAVLVTGDRDLLALAGRVPFAIEDPCAYLARFATAP
jgi:putative PIN family toxin of toxin-antitoxin system